MAKLPVEDSAPDLAETPQAKAKAAARKAAQAAAIAETYSARTEAAAIPPKTMAATPPAEKGPAEADTSASGDQSEDLKLRDLLELALEGRDLKRSQAKPAIQAALEALGAVLAEGRSVNLPGLGKVMVKRSKVANGKRVSELRLRQKLDDGAATERVAEDDEDS